MYVETLLTINFSLILKTIYQMSVIISSILQMEKKKS